ncbi:MAG: hypothetical protein R2875_12915 [Desulfobacterales bacterium]
MFKLSRLALLCYDNPFSDKKEFFDLFLSLFSYGRRCIITNKLINNSPMGFDFPVGLADQGIFSEKGCNGNENQMGF